MGAWGTGLSSNDTFEDIYREFFIKYHSGEEPNKITSYLIERNQELINSEEDKNNFWFALAKAQWECKALTQEVYSKVHKIISSKDDLKKWDEMGASKGDLKKRAEVLDNFLLKLSHEKKNPKKRQAVKLINSIFEKGTCLVFKDTMHEYRGAFVLESEVQTELGMNLIAITESFGNENLSLIDFKRAKIQIAETDLGNHPDIYWYSAKFSDGSIKKLKNIGKIRCSKTFQSDKDYQSLSPWENLFDRLAYNSKQTQGKNHLSLKKLRLKWGIV